jgi:hypothetical protein
MISVENFYWVLYENLLKPCKIDCWYYYPFGSTDNLSRAGEFTLLLNIKRQDHVLFHFDQEPLWDQSLGKIYDTELTTAWSRKMVRILANSEKSDIKKTICRNRDMLDWYFFYHGFAALDWFRDSQFITDQREIKNVFLSLNHLVTDNRSYRMSLWARFVHNNVLHRGTMSFHGTLEDCLLEIHNNDTKISTHSQDLIK